MQRSVAAALAAILELDPADVPVPDERHPEPWTVWTQWLALRGLGLVPIADPSRFNWPGPWLAVLASPDGDVGAVAFGSPPGIAWKPFDGPEGFDAVRAGYAVAPADVALWSAPAAAGSLAGRVEAIVIAPDAEAPMVRVDRAVARADRGLEGDRYFEKRGTFSKPYARGHDLTLIEAEALDGLARPLAPEEARRNVLTRGIDLNALVGKPFTIGDVRCLGQRLCEPCAHLERLTPGTLRPLIHKGGLRADVLSDGEIRVGDEISG
jgi:hypothetical protein